MTLAATLLVLAAACDGLLEGAHWTDTEDALLCWPEGKGRHDLYHPLRGFVRVGAFLAVGLGLPFGPAWLGVGMLAFAFSEIARDAYTGLSQGHGLTLVYRWRKQSLRGLPRYPLVERLVCLLIGGWLAA